jgi:hypothetical protein
MMIFCRDHTNLNNVFYRLFGKQYAPNMKPNECKFWVLVLFTVLVQMAVAKGIVSPAAKAHTLALFAQFEHIPSVQVWSALARDLSEHVLPGDWVPELIEATGEVAGREFSEIIRVDLIGTCQPLKKRAAPWRPEPLGWVRKVDGTVLHFVFVNCDRVAEAVSRLDIGEVSDQEYAAALAKVIRHELRHILLNTDSHECKGDYKASLSARDLIGTDRATHSSSSSPPEDRTGLKLTSASRTP